MTRASHWLFSLILVSLIPCLPAAANPGIIAITHVNVVPMNEDRVQPDQTVILRGTRIAQIAPADKAHVPLRAQRIDGTVFIFCQD